MTLTASSTANATFAQTAIGQSTSQQVLQLQLNQALAITSIAVQPSTGSKQEFVVGTVTGCVVNGASVNPVGSICSVPIAFTPAFPGLRQQPLVLVDSSGVAYSFGLTGIGSGPQTLLLPGNVTTVGGIAGTTATTALGDGAAASAAAIYGPEGIFVDNSSNIYIADTTHNRIRVIFQSGSALACLIEEENPALFGLTGTTCAGAAFAPTPGFIYTIAGNGTAGYNSDAVMATASELNAPASITVDAAGDIYIGDVTNSRIRVLYAGGTQAACLVELENGVSFGLGASPTSCSGATSAPTPGFIYTVAGTGTGGWSGDGGLASTAKIVSPYGVALDSAGDLFIATDSATAGIGSHIRVLYQGGANAAGLIALENPGTTPVVGNIYTVLGNSSSTASTGDNGLAINAGMLYAYGLSVDLNGNIYFPDKTSGTAPTVTKGRVLYYSGSTLATLIGIENSGVTATPGYVYTIAGTGTPGSGADGGLATSSALSGPYDEIVDAAGNIYLAERLNETIRKVNASTGVITTIAGVAGLQNVTSGTATTTARLWGPWSLALDSFGGIYFTDNGANRLRNDSAAAGTVSFASTSVGSASADQYVTVANIGTGSLQLSGLGVSSNFGLTPAGTDTNDCALSSLVAAGSTCLLPISFSPQAGGVITGTATVTDNSLNANAATHIAALSGTGAGTTTTLTTVPAAPTYGQSVTLNATLTDSNSNPVTTGSVVFTVGGTALGSAAVNASTGVATITTTALPGGAITVNTAYAANGGYTESNASTALVVAPAPVTITVNAASTVYGAALPVFTGSNGAVQNGDTLSIKYTTTATASSNAGTYPITAVLIGISATNYVATVNPALLTVTPAPLTVAANAASRPINTANPALTYTVTGFANGDTSSILTGAPALSTTAVLSSPIGNYPITIAQGTLAATANYNLRFVNALLQVTYVGTQTITFAPIPNATYGSAPFTVSATASSGLPVTISLVSGANVSLSGSTTALIGGTVTITGAGPVTLQASQAGNSSYPAATAVNQSFTVNPATLTVKASNTTYIYGAPTALSGTVTGSVGTDSFTPTFTTSAGTTTPVPAGIYTITPAVTPAGSTNAANYSIGYTVGTLTVTKAGSSTTLISSTANANLGTAILLTATVVPATAGVPTGTVTFKSGATILGTSTLNASGGATLTVTGLAVGSQQLVASYSGDNNFTSSANSGITITVTAPSYTLTSSVLGIAIASGQSGSVSLTVGSSGGYTGTLTPSCGTQLPADISCQFTPSTLISTGNNATQTMTVAIGTRKVGAMLAQAPSSTLFALIFWTPGPIFYVLGLRRRALLKSWQRMAMLALAIGGGLACAGALTGCGGGPATLAATGTFNVPITLTDGTTPSTVNVTVTVTGVSSVN